GCPVPAGFMTPVPTRTATTIPTQTAVVTSTAGTPQPTATPAATGTPVATPACGPPPPAGPPLDPADDPFYTSPDPIVDPPGTVLKSRQVALSALSANATGPFEAWQLMFASTDANGDPAAAMTTIIVPCTQASTTPRPLVSYQTAE